MSDQTTVPVWTSKLITSDQQITALQQHKTLLDEQRQQLDRIIRHDTRPITADALIDFADAQREIARTQREIAKYQKRIADQQTAAYWINYRAELQDQITDANNVIPDIQAQITKLDQRRTNCWQEMRDRKSEKKDLEAMSGTIEEKPWHANRIREINADIESCRVERDELWRQRQELQNSIPYRRIQIDAQITALNAEISATSEQQTQEVWTMQKTESTDQIAGAEVKISHWTFMIDILRTGEVGQRDLRAFANTLHLNTAQDQELFMTAEEQTVTSHRQLKTPAQRMADMVVELVSEHNTAESRCNEHHCHDYGTFRYPLNEDPTDTNNYDIGYLGRAKRDMEKDLKTFTYLLKQIDDPVARNDYIDEIVNRLDDLTSNYEVVKTWKVGVDTDALINARKAGDTVEIATLTADLETKRDDLKPVVDAERKDFEEGGQYWDMMNSPYQCKTIEESMIFIENSWCANGGAYYKMIASWMRAGEKEIEAADIALALGRVFDRLGRTQSDCETNISNVADSALSLYYVYGHHDFCADLFEGVNVSDQDTAAVIDAVKENFEGMINGDFHWLVNVFSSP